MVPKSYVDLKRYLVDDSNLAGGDMETVKIVQKPILPSPKPKEMVLPTNTPDESLTSSDVSQLFVYFFVYFSFVYTIFCLHFFRSSAAIVSIHL